MSLFRMNYMVHTQVIHTHSHTHNSYLTVSEQHELTHCQITILLEVNLLLGLDKICLAKFEQNGQPKERSNSASKMGCQFCQKSKMGKE